MNRCYSSKRRTVPKDLQRHFRLPIPSHHSPKDLLFQKTGVAPSSWTCCLAQVYCCLGTASHIQAQQSIAQQFLWLRWYHCGSAAVLEGTKVLTNSKAMQAWQTPSGLQRMHWIAWTLWFEWLHQKLMCLNFSFSMQCRKVEQCGGIWVIETKLSGWINASLW